MKTCAHCSGAILVGVTGYGGPICHCWPSPDQIFDSAKDKGIQKAEANARFVVKAVNYHDRLREALAQCATELAVAIEGKYHGILGYPSTDRDYRTDMAIVEQARALLAELENMDTKQ